MNSLADVFWAMIMFYFVFMIIWIFIRLFADIFRRQDLTGLWKVIWIVVLFWIPFLGAMIYIFSRPKLDTDTDVFARHRRAGRPGTAAGRDREPVHRGRDRQAGGAPRLRRHHPGRVRRRQGEGAGRLMASCEAWNQGRHAARTADHHRPAFTSQPRQPTHKEVP